MPTETPPPHLVDAIKASALKLKERQAALDARAKELDVLKARLDAEREELDTRARQASADQTALERERREIENARTSLDQDRAAVAEGQSRLAKDEEDLRRSVSALEERERLLKADEERVGRLQGMFAQPLKDSETQLHGLLDREQELMRLQTDWLAAIEARQKELRAIADEMHTHRDEFARQHESISVLKDGLKGELHRLLGELETLKAKETSLVEAENFLASALEIERGMAQDPAPVTPSPPAMEPPAPEPTPVPEPPAPTVAPLETPAAPVPVQVEEELPPSEPKGRATKSEATERLSKAVETWKRARDAGWKVTDIRKTVKSARDAIEGGDYDRAVRLSVEILEQLEAVAPAR